MSNYYCQPKSSFFLIFKPELLRQASWYTDRERETHTQTHTQRVSHSVLELLGGCCWFCSFLFSFFGFDEIVQPLSFLLVSLTRRSKQGRRKPGGSGVGREVKGSEEREGKRGKGREGECLSV
jgi:hypothetical protein